jgi:hypothetical protein
MRGALRIPVSDTRCLTLIPWLVSVESSRFTIRYLHEEKDYGV